MTSLVNANEWQAVKVVKLSWLLLASDAVWPKLLFLGGWLLGS
jgi:hypothetical protein